MSRAPGRDGYPAAMRAVHWATAALLAGSYSTTWAITGATSSDGVEALSQWHRSFGVIILCLTAIRLAVRRRSRVPELPQDMPGLQRLAARLNVIGLYALLVLQPLLGLTAGMLQGGGVTLLGGLVLPSLLPLNRKLAHRVFEVHGTVALLLLGLIGMHAAAALYHHFVRRDGVLAGMLPGAGQFRGGR